MLKGYLKQTDSVLKLIIFTGLILVFFGLFSIISIPLTAWVFGKDLTELMTAMQGANATVDELKFMQVMAQVGMMIVPAALAAYLFSINSFEYLSFRRVKFSSLIIILILTLAATPLINFFWNGIVNCICLHHCNQLKTLSGLWKNRLQNLQKNF